MSASTRLQFLARTLTWIALSLALAFIAAAFRLQQRMDRWQMSVESIEAANRAFDAMNESVDAVGDRSVTNDLGRAQAELARVAAAFPQAQAAALAASTRRPELSAALSHAAVALDMLIADLPRFFSDQSGAALEIELERELRSRSELLRAAVHAVIWELRNDLLSYVSEMRSSNRNARWLIAFACVMGGLIALLVYFRQRDRDRWVEESRARFESDERLNLLLARAPVVLWSTDRDLRITFLGGSAVPPSPTRTEEWVGRSLAEYLGANGAANTQLAHHRAALAGDVGRYAIEWSGRSYLAHLAPLRSTDGSILGVAGAAVDTTEHQQIEQKLGLAQQRVRHLEKMEAIGRLASYVAHDFNNFLTVVLGYAGSVMTELPPDSPLRFEVEEIARTAERASWLTRQLLAFSRPSRLEASAIDLAAAIRELAPLLERQLGSNIALALELAPDLPPILAHPTQVEQIVLNLALNARDAMPDGGQLTIRVGADARDDGSVVLQVQDSGAGMSLEIRERLFEPFFSTKEDGSGSGSGLGLAIVDSLVRERGGSITVESAPGQGSTFRMRFPAAPANSPRAPVPQHQSTPPLGRGESILVVEDDDSVRTLTTRVLEAQGYKVASARSGAEAIEWYERRRTPLDLLLSDERMPRMIGNELVRQLRLRQPGLRAILISTHVSGSEDAARNVGAEFLHKPFTVAELFSKVRAALDG